MIVELYTKDDCSFCVAAKALLSVRGITYTEQKLGINFTRDTLKQKFPTAQSFPVIVVDNFYIGGYNQLKEELDKSNSSQQLLNE
jgi:glutaredoxin 3